MYVSQIPNRNSKPTWLIRTSTRVGNKVVKTTISNITRLPQPIIDGIGILLKGGTAVKTIKDAFEIRSSKPHGHVAAVLGMMTQLKIHDLIAPKNSRFRRLVLGMIAARVLDPASKLRTSTMLNQETAADTLNEELNLKYVDQDDLYEAMDQLAKCKADIECTLAKRHLTEGGMVLYDVSSSYVEGEKNFFAEFGHNRDKKKGKKQVVYGLITDAEGRPVSVEVFPGNTADTATLGCQITKIQESFGLKHVILVGDRGLLKQKQIKEEIMPVGLDWITGMQKGEIRKVVDHQEKEERRKEEMREVIEQKEIQMSLFDQQDLVELECDLYPDETLILCKNPLQAAKSKQTRDALLDKADEGLNKIIKAITATPCRLKNEAKIGMRVQKVVGKHKLKRFYNLDDIKEGHFTYSRNEQAIKKAELLDGVYAIRSSVKKAPETLVSDYKRLSSVEWAFRTMKSMSLRVRPIHHRSEHRVIAHIFLCMLAYYVEYHLRQKLAPMLEDDLQLKRAQRKDMVSPAKRSDEAKEKAQSKTTSDDETAMSYESVMKTLSGLSRVVGVPKITTDNSPEVTLFEDYNPTQMKALKLLNIKLS